MNRIPQGDKLYRLGNCWRTDFTFAGKRRTMALGTYPEISAHQARIDCLATHEMVARGQDPVLAKKKRISGTVAEIYHEWSRQIQWSDRHRHDVTKLFEGDVLPSIGWRHVSTVKSAHLLILLRTVEERAPVQASRLRGYLAQLWRHALLTEYAERDITTDLRGALSPPPVEHREGPRTLAELRAVLADAPPFLRLLAVTMVRQSELRHALAGEFDGDVWRIPAARMKAGREHWVPLSPAARELVPQVVPCALSNDQALALLQRRWPQHTLHGFRSAASTILHERGYSPTLIEMQLAHKVGTATSRAYNHAAYFPERRAMMEWFSQAALASSGETKPGTIDQALPA